MNVPKRTIGSIGVAILALAAVAWFGGPDSNTTPHTNTSPAPTATDSKATSTSPSTEWKTYRSDTFGFEFRYPPNGVVEEVKFGSILYHKMFTSEEAGQPRIFVTVSHYMVAESASRTLRASISTRGLVKPSLLKDATELTLAGFPALYVHEPGNPQASVSDRYYLFAKDWLHQVNILGFDPENPSEAQRVRLFLEGLRFF